MFENPGDAKLVDEMAIELRASAGEPVWTLSFDAASELSQRTVASTIDEFLHGVVPANAAAASNFTLTYSPPTPTISAAGGASGSRVSVSNVVFTFTYSSDVNYNAAYNMAGFAAAVGLDVGPMSATVSSASVSATEIEVTVHLTDLAPYNITIGPVPELLALVSPRAAASTNNFTLEFVPSAVSISGDTADGGATAWSEFNVQYTFDVPVSGVVASDFNLAVTGNAATTTLTPGKAEPARDWVLRVTLVDPSTAATVTVGPVAESQGSIVPETQANAATHTITYNPPVAGWNTSATGASGSDSQNPSMEFAFTVASPVAGVVEDSFACTATVGAGSAQPVSNVGTVTVSAVGAIPAATWKYNVVLDPYAGSDSTVVACTLADAAPGTSPPIVVDAGASNTYTLSYTPPAKPEATYRSGELASGGTMYGASVTFTATFTAPVTGVTADHFGVTSSSGSSTLVTTLTSLASADPAATWMLQVDVTAGLVQQTISVAAMNADLAGISPANGASTDSFSVVLEPATPVLSSSTNPSDDALVITATFSVGVTGLTEAAMNLASDTSMPYTTAFAAAPATTELVEVSGFAWVDPVANGHTQLSPTTRVRQQEWVLDVGGQGLTISAGGTDYTDIYVSTTSFFALGSSGWGNLAGFPWALDWCVAAQLVRTCAPAPAAHILT